MALYMHRQASKSESGVSFFVVVENITNEPVSKQKQWMHPYRVLLIIASCRCVCRANQPPPSPHVGQTTYNESCSRVSEATYEQRAKVDKNASDVVFDGSYRCLRTALKKHSFYRSSIHLIGSTRTRRKSVLSHHRYHYHIDSVIARRIIVFFSFSIDWLLRPAKLSRPVEAPKPMRNKETNYKGKLPERRWGT